MPNDDARESDDLDRPLETLGCGKFLRLVRDGRWEFVQRTNTTGVVAIVALTDDGSIVLTEQYRAAVQCPVVELPAGLAGDTPGDESEVALTAAERELLEETGFRADKWTLLAYGPPSAGMSDECVALFLAERLTKVSVGGGDEDEQITVHEVPLSEAPQWLERFEENGSLIDPKVFAGLFFALVAASQGGD